VVYGSVSQVVVLGPLPVCRVLLEKLRLAQLVKKFPSSYGARRLLLYCCIHKSLLLDPILSHMNPAHILILKDPS